MEMNKNIFICALMALMILVCVGAVSAEDTLDAEVASAEADEPIAVESVDEVAASEPASEALAADSGSEVLSASGDIIYVDPAATNANAAGTVDDPCQTIKKAVAKATGGETIFLKNGVYNGNYQNGNYAIQNDAVGSVSKVLNIVGESRDGVIINASCNSFAFISSTADFSLTNITFKTVAKSLNMATTGAINIKGAANANIINCSFIESELTKAIIISTTGNVLIENFTMANSAIANSANVFQSDAQGTVTMKNAVFKDNYFQAYSANTEKINYLISITKAAWTMENVVIANNNVLTQNGLIYITNGASLNMVDCRIKNNTVSPYSKTVYSAIFYLYGSSSSGYGSLDIQQSVISDNKDICYIFKKTSSNAVLNANYNNFHNNTLVPNGNTGTTGGTITSNNGGAYNLDNNWWGSNVAPTNAELGTYGTSWALNSYVIDSGDYNYVLNDSTPLEKTIPELPGTEPVNLTNDTFFKFFDEDGILRESYTDDELVFHGLFENLTGVNTIIIDRPITLISDNAVLNNIAISIIDDGVKLSGFTFNADHVEFNANGGAVVYVSGSDVEIDNVIVNYDAPGEVEAIAVYANAADNFALTNSEISFVSTNPGNKHNYGLKVRNSETAVIDNNIISAILPAVDVAYGSGEGIDLDLVLAVGIQGGRDINFTNNRVDVGTNGGIGYYPTIDSVMVHSTVNILIESNNITHIDTTVEDASRYYNALDLYNLTANVNKNNIIVNTTAGVDRSGTAYPIQVTGPALVEISDNNLTSVSKGATAGIYASNWGGPATLTISDNNIDVSGYATTGNYALVSGIEAEIDTVFVYNNTITVNNAADFDDANQAYGISMAASYMSSDPSADIKDNNITVNGKYAVYYAKAVNTNVTYNDLYAQELFGDDAAAIDAGSNNVIENNTPVVYIPTNLTITVSDVFEGQTALVTVTSNATGDVIIRVNGKEYPVTLNDEFIATQEIPAEDLIAGTNTANATFVASGKYLTSFNETTFEVIGNVVTQENFYTFFDESGILMDEVPFDELIFKGEFSDLAAGYVIITKPVTITGDNAVLNNMGFVIASEDVALDSLTLVATTSLGDLISVTESNVSLTNLDMSYSVDDGSANVINVKGSDTLSNINILNNTIDFESHATKDNLLVTAINLDDVEDVIVDGNNIVANIPSLTVSSYDFTYFMMGLTYVNPIRVYEASGVELTNNSVDVTVNSYDSSFPTVQSLYIAGSEDVLVEGNNFTMVDTLTPAGTPIYLYAIECGFSEGIEFIENNFNISTTGGKSGSGSAYALQVATSEATFIGNNITCDSNGPNLGIYSPYGFGPAKDLVIKENFINVTGYAAGSDDYALVSGIEVQTGYATIYNNIIYAQNKGEYNDAYPVAGISAVQYSASTLSFDIKDNEIYTNGKYTVNMQYPPSGANVTGNYLIANELFGDESVFIKSGDKNVVEYNLPADLNLTVSVDNIVYGEDAVISISYNASAIGNIIVTVNGTNYEVNDDGKVIVPQPMVGEYPVIVKFESDSIYFLSDELETAFNVTQAGSSVTIDPIEDVVYGNPVVINFTIVNETDFVTISVNDVNDPDKVIEYVNGETSITVNDLPAGDYIVNIHNGENELYTESQANATFSVLQAGSSVTIDPVEDVVYGNPVVITFNIVNETDFVTISVIDVNDPDKVIEYEYAEGNITVNDLPVGDYIVNIHNGESDLYTESEANATFSVLKVATALTADNLVMSYKDGSAWTVTLTDTNGNAISAATVGIGINGKVYNVKTNDNGNAGLVINLAPGTHAINATFVETPIFESAFVNATVTVDAATVTLSADNLVMSYKDGSAWAVTLTDDKGNAISGVNIAFDINGATYNVKTGADGIAKLPINLAPKTYDVKATFAGSKYYSEASVNATVTVEKATAVLSASNLTMSYKDGSAWEVTLTDANGNVISGVSVALGINGATYNVKTDANGIAKLPINLNMGKYDVTATLNNAYYEAEAIANTVNVTDYEADLVASDINMTYKDGTAYEVQLVDGEGNNIAVANLIVKITIKGSTYNVKTDANGIAKLPINLYIGTYDISAEYNGKVINNTITVNKA